MFSKNEPRAAIIWILIIVSKIENERLVLIAIIMRYQQPYSPFKPTPIRQNWLYRPMFVSQYLSCCFFAQKPPHQYSLNRVATRIKSNFQSPAKNGLNTGNPQPIEK
jgi:hypothetical protein